ncbi:hypothetical protein [Promicromonospora sp. NPDC023805]
MSALVRYGQAAPSDDKAGRGSAQQNESENGEKRDDATYGAPPTG